MENPVIKTVETPRTLTTPSINYAVVNGTKLDESTNQQIEIQYVWFVWTPFDNVEKYVFKIKDSNKAILIEKQLETNYYLNCPYQEIAEKEFFLEVQVFFKSSEPSVRVSIGGETEKQSFAGGVIVQTDITIIETTGDPPPQPILSPEDVIDPLWDPAEKIQYYLNQINKQTQLLNLNEKMNKEFSKSMTKAIKAIKINTNL